VTEGGLGEKVAAGLRELLHDPDRAPVLVLATLWPEFWGRLTVRPDANAPDPHAQARELLAGHDITVPAAFTARQLQEIRGAADTRLAQAAVAARDGQVIQFLAGAPELLARYRNAAPVASALMHAAMDARRLGAGIELPRAFLESAAPGYLTDDEWDALDDDWIEQALAYTAKPARGVRGPLTRIRPRAAEPAIARPRQLAGSPASMPGGPQYRLADYLDQHGRAIRNDLIPPPEFWAAAAAHAAPGDQSALGDAAYNRRLYRAAAQLHKNAAAAGSINSARYLARPPGSLREDPRPAWWAAAHANLSDPTAVATLLDSLREAGAHEQATALLARDPAAHANLSDPTRVATLLVSLREAGAHEQVAALAARAAAEADLSNPSTVAELLDSLREAGAHEQAAALLARPFLRAAEADREYRNMRALRKAMQEQNRIARALTLLTRSRESREKLLDMLEERRPGDRFHFGREGDGSPAPPWRWDDLD